MDGKGSRMEEEREAREPADAESTSKVTDTQSGSRRERMVLQALENLHLLATVLFLTPPLDREVTEEEVRVFASLEGIEYAVVREKIELWRLATNNTP